MSEVGIKDVAARAQLSVTTVSHALNRPELVSERAVVRVREAAAALGYVPNVAARQLRAGRSRVLGMAVPDITNPFFADVLLGAEEAAAERGYDVVLAASHRSAAKEGRSLELFERHRYDGVLITPLGEGTGRVERFAARGVPVVLIDRRDPDARIPGVSVDNVLGGRLAVQHLVDRGCRRPWVLPGPTGVTQLRERLTGARQAARSAKVPLEVVRTASLGPATGREIGERIAALPEHERPDGVFVASDLAALGLLQSLLSHGLDVPGQVCVVGYDDIEFASSSLVPLTTVRQPAYEMGATAARILLTQLEGGEPLVSRRFEPELVVRATTRSRHP